MEEKEICIHINTDVIYEINFKDIPNVECCYCFDNPVIIFLNLLVN
jgi:hypothetical protein